MALTGNIERLERLVGLKVAAVEEAPPRLLKLVLHVEQLPQQGGHELLSLWRERTKPVEVHIRIVRLLVDEVVVILVFVWAHHLDELLKPQQAVEVAVKLPEGEPKYADRRLHPQCREDLLPLKEVNAAGICRVEHEIEIGQIEITSERELLLPLLKVQEHRRHAVELFCERVLLVWLHMRGLDRQLVGMRCFAERGDLRYVFERHGPWLVSILWLRAVRHLVDGGSQISVHGGRRDATSLEARPQRREAACRRCGVVHAQIRASADLRRRGVPHAATGRLVKTDGLFRPSDRVKVRDTIRRYFRAGQRVDMLQHTLHDLLLDALLLIPTELGGDAGWPLPQLNLLQHVAWDEALGQVLEHDGASSLPIQPRDYAVEMKRPSENSVVLEVSSKRLASEQGCPVPSLDGFEHGVEWRVKQLIVTQGLFRMILQDLVNILADLLKLPLQTYFLEQNAQ